MKKSTVLIIFLVVAIFPGFVFAQEKEYYQPAKGKWSIGVTFNAASLGSACSMQPKAGDMAGAYITDLASNPKQMFILSQDPVAAMRAKYYTSDKMALRMALGLNGSLINYREYVRDDYAANFDPDTENKVIDRVCSELNSVSFQIGMEGMKGNKVVRFTYGFDLMYAVAGGRMTFDYGNELTDLNRVPSTMPMMGKGGDLNDFEAKLGIAYGRPLERYNSGYIHGLGISVDMGIEVFVAQQVSLGVAINFTPIMVTFQPKTYTVYEGFSTNTGKVEHYNGLVSPGSNALLYGTENIGCRISLNYYF